MNINQTPHSLKGINNLASEKDFASWNCQFYGLCSNSKSQGRTCTSQHCQFSSQFIVSILSEWAQEICQEEIPAMPLLSTIYPCVELWNTSTYHGQIMTSSWNQNYYDWLTSWARVIGILTAVQLLKKFPAFYLTTKYITRHRRASHVRVTTDYLASPCFSKYSWSRIHNRSHMILSNEATSCTSLSLSLLPPDQVLSILSTGTCHFSSNSLMSALQTSNLLPRLYLKTEKSHVTVQSLGTVWNSIKIT